jgi:hypothetical protein
MTILLISTSRRHTPVDQPSGHIMVMDLEKREIIRRCEIIEPPYRVENPNPRGGLRGSKGISVAGNRIAIANASTIFLYDEEWTPITYFYHPSCAGVHDIVLDGETVWVTSARNDILCQLDFTGKMLNYYDTRTFASILTDPKWKPPVFLTREQILNGTIDFRDPRTHDEVFADASHANSLAKMANGDLLLSCGLLKKQGHLRLLYLKNWMIRAHLWEHFESVNRFFRKKLFKMENRHVGELVVQPAKGSSAIFRVGKNNQVTKCLTLPDATAPSHSVRALKDGSAIYLKTTNGELIHFNPENGEIYAVDQVGGQFLRGATELEDGTLILGDNNKLIHYDLKKHQPIFSLLASPDDMEAIFDFAVLPVNFTLPPESFVNYHAQFMPVNQI